MEVHDIVQEAVIKTIHKKKKCKKAKWLSEEVLHTATKRREAKGKGKKERYSHFFQNFPQFIVIHTVRGFGIINKAEIDVFLELSSFFHDPEDFGNLTKVRLVKAMVFPVVMYGCESWTVKKAEG